MKVVIELPEIQAVSRNQTNGKYWDYSKQMSLATKWFATYAKRHEHHFEGPVDVTIIAYYDGRKGKMIPDSPNIDDKIFTDVLNRYYSIVVGQAVDGNGKKHRVMQRLERNPYFIEDDNPTYLRYVKKRSVASDGYKVVIVVEDCGKDDLAEVVSVT